MRRRWFFVAPLLLLTLACDQTSKRLAAELLHGLAPHAYMGGSVTLIYSENQGAFLGFGAALGDSARFWLFTVGVSLLLIVFAVKLFHATSWMEIAGWALIVGGGLGNLLDRVFHDGRVIDFMRLGIGGLRTGIFNVADVAVVLGLLALFAAALTPLDPATLRKSEPRAKVQG